MWDLQTIVKMNEAAARGERGTVPGTSSEEDRKCPQCGSRMWDNRPTKRNPRAPDFKCRNRECDYVVWPHRRPLGAPKL